MNETREEIPVELQSLDRALFKLAGRALTAQKGSAELERRVVSSLRALPVAYAPELQRRREAGLRQNIRLRAGAARC